jgi:hypothetical protein
MAEEKVFNSEDLEYIKDYIDRKDSEIFVDETRKVDNVIADAENTRKDIVEHKDMLVSWYNSIQTRFDRHEKNLEELHVKSEIGENGDVLGIPGMAGDGGKTRLSAKRTLLEGNIEIGTRLYSYNNLAVAAGHGYTGDDSSDKATGYTWTNLTHVYQTRDRDLNGSKFEFMYTEEVRKVSDTERNDEIKYHVRYGHYPDYNHGEYLDPDYDPNYDPDTNPYGLPIKSIRYFDIVFEEGKDVYIIPVSTFMKISRVDTPTRADNPDSNKYDRVTIPTGKYEITDVYLKVERKIYEVVTQLHISVHKTIRSINTTFTDITWRDRNEYVIDGDLTRFNEADDTTNSLYLTDDHHFYLNKISEIIE